MSDYGYFIQLKKFFSDIPFFVIGDICLDRYYRGIILKECSGFVVNPYILDLEKMVELRKNSLPVELPGVYAAEKEGGFCINKKMVYVKSFVPRHEIFMKPGYKHPFAKRFKHATVMTMFGCPFLCSYCPSSKFAPVVRRHKDVVKELEYLKDLGIKELYFADRTFGFPRKNSLAILDNMIDRFNFSWSCFLHPKLYSAQLLEKMSLAGCHTVNIGIDSANLGFLKRYKRDVEKDEITQIIDKANELKMSICADFIIGLDHETEKDVMDSISYALHLPIDFASFNVAAPLPGSEIREKAILEGMDVWEIDGFDSSGRDKIMGTVKISHERLQKLRTYAIRRFYGRPAFFLRRLRKTSSLEHLRMQMCQMVKLFF